MEDEAEEEDLAAQARKRLGIPEFDPNASLLATLPKMLKLGDSIVDGFSYLSASCYLHPPSYL